MNHKERTPAFWIFFVFLVVSVFLMLIGQTMSIFDYEFTVRHGLQESADEKRLIEGIRKLIAQNVET